MGRRIGDPGRTGYGKSDQEGAGFMPIQQRIFTVILAQPLHIDLESRVLYPHGS
jgi:hypothetical protein